MIQLLTELPTLKSFSILLNFKLNITIGFLKELLYFSLTRLNTCQKELKVLPQIGSQVLISQLSEEIDFSIELSEKAVFVLSYGIEKVLGNSDTDIGDNPEATSTNTFFEGLGLEKILQVFEL